MLKMKMVMISNYDDNQVIHQEMIIVYLDIKFNIIEKFNQIIIGDLILQQKNKLLGIFNVLLKIWNYLGLGQPPEIHTVW